MTRISFGIIALNAMPFLEYNIRALYPIAHEIIVSEGAVRAARSLAAADGHSTDGTLEMLRRFQEQHDPDGKLRVLSAAEEGYSDGFWPEKTEMSRAYARHISGDWLWQVDSDEFYLQEDLAEIALQLDTDKEIDTISFPYTEFFGGFESTITGVWHKYHQPLCHRVFRWGPGYEYKSHRPPTVLDSAGRDLRNGKWISAPLNGARPIVMYHYSYVFPKQAEQKVGYYSSVEWTTAFRENERWYQDSYLKLKRPMFLGEKGWPQLQWLERFRGSHPKVIQELQKAIASGVVREESRQGEDIRRLLASPFYGAQRLLARIGLAIYWPFRTLWKAARNRVLGGGRA
jgi:hypothetical protein